MKKQVYLSSVKDGVINSYVLDSLLKGIELFDGKRICITVEQKRNKRSLNQNKYYWLVVIGCFIQGAEEAWGEKITREAAHDILKIQCNGKEQVNTDTGEVIKIQQDTKSLDTFEFEQYQDRCRKFIFTWFDLTVPLPNEVDEIQLTKLEQENE